MAGVKRKQHYVPKLLLREFTHDPKREHLFSFDKIIRKSHPSNISDVAHKLFFYDIDPQYLAPDADPQVIENFLDDVEGKCATAIRDFIENVETTGITEYHKDALAFFILFQIFRMPGSRERMNTFFKQGPEVLKAFAEIHNLPCVPDLSVLSGYREEMASLWHGRMLSDLPGLYLLSQPLKDLTWFVGVNDTPIPYWISDNPVIYYNHLNHEFTWPIVAPGTEILFPVTSRLLLLLREKTHLPKEIGRNGRCVPFTEEDVEDSNVNQLRQCTRQVYSPIDDFGSAIDECRNHPEIYMTDEEYILEEFEKIRRAIPQ